MSIPHCPATEKLAAFALGRMGEIDAEPIAEHLDACLTCAETIDQLAESTDVVLTRLKLPTQGRYAGDAQCRQVLDRVKMLGHAQTLVGEPTVTPDDASPVSTRSVALSHLRDYELLEKVGEGGMGAVYRARHARLDKTVAVKVLPADRLRNPAAVARFQREMRAVGKLDHPHLVRAMDAGEVDGTHFLVMEYVEGVDLAQLVREHGPLPIAEACELIRQAAIGLEEAHEQGLVHRDIKPSNLMLCQVRAASGRGKPPVVKVLDLGLALLAEAHTPETQGLTSAGQLMGTLDYMAPEQGSDSHIVDIRADIYSLGATLYKLLTGEAIYYGPAYQTPVQKLMALANSPAPPIQSRRREVPAALAAVVHRMLEKNPSRRNASPKEVAEALAPVCAKAKFRTLLSADAISQEQPRDDAKVHPKPRASQPARKLAVLLAAGVVAVVAGVLIFWQTSSGTVRIQINDPTITAQIGPAGATIRRGEERPIELKLGTHGLRIKQGDLAFETVNFVLTRGEAATLIIELLPGRVQVTDAQGRSIGSVKLPPPPIAAHVDRPAEGRTTAEVIATNPDDGFVPLFNRDDLSGWKVKRSATIVWRNENGTITGRNNSASPNSAGQLCSQKEYQNFHFCCEVLAGSGVLPIIMFRDDDSLAKGKRRGYALIDPVPGAPLIAEGWGHGSLYADDFQVQPHQSRLAPSGHKDLGINTGDWYRLEFIAQGQAVEVRINGRMTTTFSSTHPELNKPGSITLRCGAGAKIAFRNLEIKELSPE